jgi:hypothetical protein
LNFDAVLLIKNTDVSASNTEAAVSPEVLVSTTNNTRYHNPEDLRVIRRRICMQMRPDVLMFCRAASKPAVLALYGSECWTVVKVDERRTGTMHIRPLFAVIKISEGITS